MVIVQGSKPFFHIEGGQDSVPCRPILFSGPLVRPILDGRKTQTRRLVKPQPGGIWGSGVARPGNLLGVRSDAFHVHANVQSERRFLYCPYGKPGDRLWVRETWCKYGSAAIYRADYEKHSPISDGIGGPWRPSIHMPRWASRITLEVTQVRVQRLQEISEEDVQSEGCTGSPFGSFADKMLFPTLWDSLAKPGATWAENPWVWAITFRKVAT